LSHPIYFTCSCVCMKQHPYIVLCPRLALVVRQIGTNKDWSLGISHTVLVLLTVDRSYIIKNRTLLNTKQFQALGRRTVQNSHLLAVSCESFSVPTEKKHVYGSSKVTPHLILRNAEHSVVVPLETSDY